MLRSILEQIKNDFHARAGGASVPRSCRGGACCRAGRPICRPIHPSPRRSIPAGRTDRCPAQRPRRRARSEEHTSELQSLMRISYAVFCLKKKKKRKKYRDEEAHRRSDTKEIHSIKRPIEQAYTP